MLKNSLLLVLLITVLFFAWSLAFSICLQFIFVKERILVGINSGEVFAYFGKPLIVFSRCIYFRFTEFTIPICINLLKKSFTVVLLWLLRLLCVSFYRSQCCH